MPGTRAPASVRFWRHVSRSTESNECWAWSGGTNGIGYGMFRKHSGPGGQTTAHRYAYELLVGRVPDGRELDHTCHTEAFQRGECDGGPDCPHRACVNPAHLEVVTHAENMRRGGGGPRDACANGHGREHAYRRKSGQFAYCKICQKERARASRAAARAL